MLKYRFETMEYKNGSDDTVIIMDDEHYQLVARFLMSDVQSKDPSFALGPIDAVLNGQVDFAQTSGNVCSLEIDADTTVIYNDIDEEADPCEVDTVELRDLILKWHEAVSDKI